MAGGSGDPLGGRVPRSRLGKQLTEVKKTRKGLKALCEAFDSELKEQSGKLAKKVVENATGGDLKSLDATVKMAQMPIAEEEYSNTGPSLAEQLEAEPEWLDEDEEEEEEEEK